MTQPVMKESPPKGVIGPSIASELRPVASLVDNKYNEPENSNIPRRKA